MCRISIKWCLNLSEKSLFRVSKVYMQGYSFDKKILTDFSPQFFFQYIPVTHSMKRFLSLCSVVLIKIVTYIMHFQVELQLRVLRDDAF